MPANSRWPIVCVRADQTWIFRLRGGRLFGTSVGRHDAMEFGPVHAFDAGYSRDGEMFLLLERSHDDGKADLEIVHLPGSGPHRTESLATVAAPGFSHCLPPIDRWSDWTPGWLDGRTIRCAGEDSIALPEPLAELSALVPSGESSCWPWVFTGISCEGTGVTGLISRRRGWEPWVAAPGLQVLTPGYLPREGELWFLASHRSAMRGATLVGRRWRDNVGVMRRVIWERPRTLLTLGQTAGEGFGGVVGCPESPGFFWICTDEAVCRFGTLSPLSDSQVRECIVLSGEGGRVLPRPVRYRVHACPAARSRRPCHTNGFGVVAHRYVAPLVPEPCPLVQACRSFPSEQQAAADDEVSTGRNKIARMRRALSLALLEVEALRRERNRLRTELDAGASGRDS